MIPIFLVGCSTKTIKETQYVKIQPPTALIEPTSIPRFSGSTYGDLVEFVPELEAAVGQCNIDKESIKEYYKEEAPN